MAFGQFGAFLTFETSDRRILNFQDFKQKSSATWAEHKRPGSKPAAEFICPDYREVTFTIELNAAHGVRPRAEMEFMETVVEQGAIAPLVIAGRRVSDCNWRMTDLSEAWDRMYNQGQLVYAKMDITLKEYA